MQHVLPCEQCVHIGSMHPSPNMAPPKISTDAIKHTSSPPSEAVESALPVYLLRSSERCSGGEALGTVAGGISLSRLLLEARPEPALVTMLPAPVPRAVQGGHAWEALELSVCIACDISVVLSLHRTGQSLVTYLPSLTSQKLYDCSLIFRACGDHTLDEDGPTQCQLFPQCQSWCVSKKLHIL